MCCLNSPHQVQIKLTKCEQGKQLGVFEKSFLLGLFFTNGVGFQLTKRFSGKKIMRFVENTFSSSTNCHIRWPWVINLFIV